MSSTLDQTIATDAGVVELFAAQATRTPDAVAVAVGDKTLTYRELDERAAQLAGHLEGLGVGPDAIVGLFLERSLDLIVGLLGILKAGGAYLPLEVSLPNERLAQVLGDARPRTVLTQRSLTARLPAGTATVLVDGDQDVIAAQPRRRSGRRAGLGDLAYVIYTSGSTGVPKGIMIDHRALRDRAVAKAARYGLTPTDRMLQFTAVSFDAAAAEIYPTLLSGAALVVHPEPARTSVAELVTECERRGVTAVQLSPVMLQLLVDTLTSTGRAVPWLRLFLTGGESIPVERLAAWTRLVPHGPKFLYAYGPTETTITATLYEAPTEPAEVERLSRVPIGEAMPGTGTYVLDAELHPVAPREVGELWITGAGLARGYLGDPALTAARFLPDPFSAKPGTRMYRTGDLVRLTGTGTLEFAGRVDTQVKIRGFRVELGEIEGVLAAHPDLSHTVVVARDGQLVAYCVPSAGADVDATELRRFVGATLPDYMIPSTIVRLDNMPLLPGGKVDQHALPDPRETGPAADSGGTAAPRSPVEAVLCRIWCDLLGRERIGVDENFFDAGGDSLLANRVVSRIRDEFGVELPLREIFRASTIAGLAAVVTSFASEAGEKEDIIELLAGLERMSDDEAAAALGTDRLAR